MAGTFASRIGVGCSFGGTSQVPTRSMDFESSSSNVLDLSPSAHDFSDWNRGKFSGSFWVKRESTGAAQTIWTVGRKASNFYAFHLEFTSSDKIQFIGTANSSATIFEAVTTATYTSTSNWYHIYVLYDTTAGVGDRVRIFVDGSEVSSFDTFTESTSDVYDFDTAGMSMNIGADLTSDHFDGLMYQVALFEDTLPSIGSLISGGGSPIDVQEITGLYELFQTTADSTVNQGAITLELWDDNSAVAPTKSTDIPV